LAIGLPGFDRLPPGPARSFVEELHRLYDLAGRPGARLISIEVRRNRDLPETVSHETVSAALRGSSVPAWAKVHSVAVALAQMAARVSARRIDLDGQLGRLQELWLMANAAASTGPIPDRDPTGLPRPVPAAQPALGASGLRPRAGVHPVAGPLPPPSVRPVRPATPAERVVGGLPESNSDFAGREDLLDEVRRKLQANPTAPLVLYGLGGVGKTQLARKFTERHASDYSVIWWVPADQPERARAALAALAMRLGLAAQPSVEQTVAGLLGQLESKLVPYLLVFDGADSTPRDQIIRVIPTIGGHTIVTTRDPGWAHEYSSTSIEVPDFTRDEAVEFLCGCDPGLSGDDAAELADVLGRLPLALEQIVVLQRATQEPWSQLIHQLANAEGGLLTSGQPVHYPHTVANALRLALDRLADANPAATAVLELFAWFGAAPVSIALLSLGRDGNVSVGLARTLRDPYLLRKTIDDMRRHGLVRLRAASQTIEVQPLNRLVLHDVLGLEALQRARRNVHELLVAADPGWPDALPSWELFRATAAHVAATGLIASRVAGAPEAVLNQIRFRYLIGDYEDARRLGEEAVTAWRRDELLGSDHEVVLRAQREWANALRALGRYADARRLTTEAMRRMGENPAYGDDHPQTIAMAGSYAADLRLAGDFAEALRVAEEMQRRSLALWGPGDRRSATSRHNVAVSLRLLGRFESARTIDESEIERRRRSGAEPDRPMLLSVNALGEDLYGLGRYRDVIALLSPLADAWRQVDPHHPGRLLAGRTLALARAGLGDIGQALAELQGHHQACVAAFGANHEYTVAATISLANVSCAAGLPDEAYVHATDAAGTYRRTFGPRHPFTMAAEVNLAAVLRVMGETQSARQAVERARATLRAALGERHPYTVAAAVGLAADIARAGDTAGALALSERAYQNAHDVCGLNHPYTLAAAANLVLDRRSTGDEAGAETLEREVRVALRLTLGHESPSADAIVGGTRITITIEPTTM
jgi:tetratricopeptide (TPR) repeat protein